MPRVMPQHPARCVVLLLLLLLPACVGHRMYRPESVELHPGYTVAYIEFDDHGELWAPSQVSRAVEQLRAANEAEQGIVALVFIHGWNHNASEGDSNVLSFRKLCEQVAQQERAQKERPPRQVVGVYLGWRGKTAKIPGLRVISFFNRRGAAARIADVSATEVIYRVMKTARENPRSRTVLLGHSFGGMILEAALSQALVASLMESEDREVDFPADLVLLINPASQSIKAKQLVEILDRNRIRLYRNAPDGHRYEAPLIVSMTSAGDKATRLYFPLGLRLKGINKRYRGYGQEFCGAAGNQRTYYARTAGHYRVLHSHTVEVERLEQQREGPLSAEKIARTAQWVYDPETGQQVFTTEGSRHRFTIKKRPNALNDTPYWIMEVPGTIVPNHSRIFGVNNQEFVRSLLALTGALEPELATELIREDGVRPIGLQTLPDGGVVFLDRSQRLYEVPAGTAEPRFYACGPGETLMASEIIGVASEADQVFVGKNTRGRGAKAGAMRTEIFRNDLATGVKRQTRVMDDTRYVAAAFDVGRQRAFLAPEEQTTVGTVNLAARKSRWEPLVDVNGVPLIAELLYVGTGSQLFVSDGLGTVVRVKLGTERVTQEIVVEQLRWPSAMAFDVERNRLYVATGHDQTIWKAECADRCFQAEPFIRSDRLVHPNVLAVAADGSVWVGDLEAQVLLVFSPDGEPLHVIERLPVSAGG